MIKFVHNAKRIDETNIYIDKNDKECENIVKE